MFSELTGAIVHRQNNVAGSFSVKDTDRIEILSRLQQKLSNLRVSDIAGDKGIQGSENREPFTCRRRDWACAVIAFSTKLVVFDITGGILALVGGGLIAVTLIWKRSGILEELLATNEKIPG